MNAAPGQTPMSSPQQSALAQALGSVSPPNNPKTPAQRTDPQHLWLIGLQRIRQTLREATDQLDDKDDTTAAIITGMSMATDRLLAGIKPEEIALMCSATMLKPFSPQLSTMIEGQWSELHRPPSVPGPATLTGLAPAGPQAQPTPAPGVTPGMAGSPPALGMPA